MFTYTRSTEKDRLRRGHGLFKGFFPAFTRRDWRKQRKTPMSLVRSPADTELHLLVGRTRDCMQVSRYVDRQTGGQAGCRVVMLSNITFFEQNFPCWKCTKFLIQCFEVRCHLLTAQSVQRLGYGLDDRGSIPGRGENFFPFRQRVHTGSAAQPIA
jgi:hypothetical protein